MTCSAGNCSTPTRMNGELQIIADIRPRWVMRPRLRRMTIRAAVDLNVDLIVTHHDAWDFMFEQRDEVQSLLKENGLTHVWAHLPLDLADFGTSATLLSELGCSQVAVLPHAEARVGEFSEPGSLATVQASLTSLLSEAPCRCTTPADLC